MNVLRPAHIPFTAAVLLTFAGFHSAHGASILVLTGNGTSNLNSPLSAAGFNVINGTLSPGQISSKLDSSVVGVYIWNDGSLGNTGSPANPALAFNAADQAALTVFHATHSKFILDGLSWRTNVVPDEVGLSQNEALALAGAGGGVVLGADDASGALIVQHVNQVASWFNLNPFSGVYTTLPPTQHFGGSLFTTPHSVNPTGLTSSTLTYSEVPNGLQPNGTFLATALFGSPSGPTPGFGSGPLSTDTFNGVAYQSVNHIITTDIAGGGINNSVPEPATLVLCILGVLATLCQRLFQVLTGRTRERQGNSAAE